MFESITPSDLNVGFYFVPDNKVYMTLKPTIHTRKSDADWIASRCEPDNCDVKYGCVVVTEPFDLSEIKQCLEVDKNGERLWLAMSDHEVIVECLLADKGARVVREFDTTRFEQFIEYSVNVFTINGDNRSGFVTAANIDDNEFKKELIKSIESIRDGASDEVDDTTTHVKNPADIKQAVDREVFA